MDRDAGGANEEGLNDPRELGWIKMDLSVVGEGNEYITHLLDGRNCVTHRVINTLHIVLKTGPTTTNLILYNQGLVLFTAKPKEWCLPQDEKGGPFPVGTVFPVFPGM